MEKEKQNSNEVFPQGGGDLMPIERPEMAMAQVIDDGDVDSVLAVMERKAALAPRFKAAQDTILASQTYPQDWTPFGDNMCLGSAGAERIGRLFDIKYYEVTHIKEEFADALGKGYRYIYEGKAALGNRVTYSMGVFSSRDKLLGTKGGEIKPLEDINENHIRTAAYHIMIGNAIKSLLGLRGIPRSEWEKIMTKTGAAIANGKAPVSFANGKQGGTSKTDKEKQAQLFELCVNIANASGVIEFIGEDNDCILRGINAQEAAMQDVELANLNSIAASSFINSKGEKINGKKPGELKGKWLNSTIGRVKKLIAEEEDNNA